jgi:hypothetical protein
VPKEVNLAGELERIASMNHAEFKQTTLTGDIASYLARHMALDDAHRNPAVIWFTEHTKDCHYGLAGLYALAIMQIHGENISNPELAKQRTTDLITKLAKQKTSDGKSMWLQLRGDHMLRPFENIDAEYVQNIFTALQQYADHTYPDARMQVLAEKVQEMIIEIQEQLGLEDKGANTAGRIVLIKLSEFMKWYNMEHDIRPTAVGKMFLHITDSSPGIDAVALLSSCLDLPLESVHNAAKIRVTWLWSYFKRRVSANQSRHMIGLFARASSSLENKITFQNTLRAYSSATSRPSSSAAGASACAVAQWPCAKCTLLNGAPASECEACGAPKPQCKPRNKATLYCDTQPAPACRNKAP